MAQVIILGREDVCVRCQRVLTKGEAAWWQSERERGHKLTCLRCMPKADTAPAHGTSRRAG
jgi:hypothetical protein